MTLFTNASRGRPRCLLASATLVCLASAIVCAADPSPKFHYIARLGFTDERHTHKGGGEIGEPGTQSTTLLGSSGRYWIGLSSQYGPSSSETSDRGATAWISDETGQTTPIGYYDALHTRADGVQTNIPWFINESGTVVGHALRHQPRYYFRQPAQSAWIADRFGRTIKIGYYDENHTDREGRKFSRPLGLSNRGKLIGISYRYAPGGVFHNGQTAWVANTIGQINAIGYYDRLHTGPGGEKSSTPTAINDAGYVVGFSGTFTDGPLATGATAWVRRPDKSLHRIGLYDGVHQATDGRFHNTAGRLTESGFIGGSARRYAWNSDHGETAWLAHVSGWIRRVGLYEGRHVGAGYLVNNVIADLNEAGVVTGTTAQWRPTDSDPGNEQGRSAWVSSRSCGTLRVGLYGHEYTDTAGFQRNRATVLNKSDSLAGFAQRFVGGQGRGQDAWVANTRGQTTRVTLDDAVHTRDDGYRYSRIDGLTESGLAWGTSNRYHEGDWVGYTAWIYTRSTRTFQRFELSVRGTDGAARSTITEVHEDGSALGSFLLYGDDGTELGEQAFLYLPGQAVLLLGREVDIDLPDEGWDAFEEATHRTADGYILGRGLPINRVNPDAYPLQQGVFLVR